MLFLNRECESNKTQNVNKLKSNRYLYIRMATPGGHIKRYGGTVGHNGELMTTV